MHSGARLALVPADDVRCFWCGQRFEHLPGCEVASAVPLPGRTPGYEFHQLDKRYPLTPLTSREEFAAAQRAGDTVGHEWARSQGK